MSSTPTSQPLVSVRTALIAVLVCALSFASVVVLTAFAPEFEDKDQAGLHAYSRSALGYNFAVRLLQDVGYDVEISRDPSLLRTSYRRSLLILTPASRYDADELGEVDFERGENPTLIVLPKRWGFKNNFNPRHQGRTGLLQVEQVSELTEEVVEGLKVKRVEQLTGFRIDGEEANPQFTSTVQLLDGDGIRPIFESDQGVMFGQVEGTRTFILSEPELFNTHGLSHPENAQVMLSMIEEMIGEGLNFPIIADTTLHGFERSRNLLKKLFEPPLLGVTLVALGTAILLGWSAFLRFGRPRDPEPEIATGRQSLIESTAGLFRQTEQEASLAGDYEQVARRMTLRSLGLPEDTPPDQADALIKRRETYARAENPDLPARPDASEVSSAGSLLHFAQNYHAWNEELKNERE
ncbi:MAG: hypothetical protein CMK07_01575 [Ponticaulis sp.]|nr:hypothetical protein [Ponticaulis sp.]